MQAAGKMAEELELRMGDREWRIFFRCRFAEQVKFVLAEVEGGLGRLQETRAILGLKVHPVLGDKQNRILPLERLSIGEKFIDPGGLEPRSSPIRNRQPAIRNQDPDI